jgi:fatty-acyl-CoA synthase
MHLIENSLGEFYEKQVALDPDHEFVVYPDRNLRFTYGQSYERANNLAKGLLAIGIKKGDHVWIWRMFRTGLPLCLLLQRSVQCLLL